MSREQISTQAQAECACESEAEPNGLVRGDPGSRPRPSPRIRGACSRRR